MKKIICLLALLSLLVNLLFACKPTIDKQPELTDYDNIYNVVPNRKFAEKQGSDNYYAIEGIFMNDKQGYNNWFYKTYKGNEWQNLPYSQGTFGTSKCGITNNVMSVSDGATVARTFVCPTDGRVAVESSVKCISGQADIAVMVNGTTVFPTQGTCRISSEDYDGLYNAVDIDVKIGDELFFAVTADDVASVSWLPAVYYNGVSHSLHYNADGDYVGDVHPYYENGKLYMYHLLTDMTWRSSLAISDDMLHFRKQPIATDENNAPEQPNYYVLGVLKDKNNKYRSYFGLGNSFGSSVSTDLLTWANATGSTSDFETTYKAFVDLEKFPSGGRDPYAFYDPDKNCYRIVGLCYKQNDSSSKNSSIGMITSTNADGSIWNRETKELINFPNVEIGEPECPQMVKIGNRWYLFASMLSSRGIMGCSYWIGDENANLDEIDWSTKEEHKLDGGNFVAAQLANVGNRWYVFGWIPQQYRSDAWGGYLNLPREITVGDNGILHSNIDSYLSKLINAGRQYTYSAQSVSVDSGDFELGANKFTSRQSNSALSVFGTFERSIVKFGIEMQQGAGGLTLTQDNKEFRVQIVRRDNKCLLQIVQNGSPSYICSQIEIPLANRYDVTAIVEDGIVEMFVNGKYALTGRVGLQGEIGYTIGMFADSAGTIVSDFNVCKLASINNLNYQEVQL